MAETKENEAMEVDTTPFEPVSILKLTKDAQQKHGLRHGNYKRYGDYCDRRIRRLRRALKYTHTYKCVPNHKAKFVLRPVNADVVNDKRFLELVVFDVEHCWARGMEFKVASENEKHARQIFHARRRLIKAVQHAENLDSSVNSSPRFDEFTKTEGKAYVASIQGAALLEKRKWSEALDKYVNSRFIYQKLVKNVKNEELQALYEQRVKEISNIIKLCEYHAGKKGVDVAPDVSQLDLNETLEDSLKNVEIEEPKSEKEKKKQEKADKKKKKEQQPLPQPVPAKPTFFDLALKHFTLPQEITDIANTQPPAPAKGEAAQPAGLGGMVRNLFWGSK
ncbi:unnamed protein product [Bursaphelenchus xylophilus]|uniref:Signal recognition particle subunit SRP68 n=1 Tax=Bursaphelenchus xylophilus TaxID=6326 RepID=A0A1I7SAT1_BURXY|nr:unnamed protein product [Bursaphelenchus xylophilus]CAG9126798.1 unnamed protein product [Bursaphelenchus xylophilus]